jgi:uncharacterized membrane protein YheB (UPF0754 family)
MAGICFDLFTEKLFSVQEVFSRLDPVRFSLVMEDSLLLLMDQVISQVAMEHMPTVWQKLPKEVKDDIIVTADTENGPFLTALMKDMQEHVEDVLDIKHLCVTACVEHKELLVKVFQECGDKEFIFIRRSGFYFGFLFGLFQMVVWFFYDSGWVLPAAGFMVGWVTNYLALKVIFRPLEPKQILCWEVQGIFLKRQNEVSEIFSRVIMTEILHVKAIWDAIFTGPLSVNFFAMLRAHTLVFVERLLSEVKPLVIAALGADAYARMKEDIAQKVIEQLPSIIDNSYEYTQEALAMENTVKTEMQGLSPTDFEGVLHPAFEEDEIQLILLGGILGAIVGVIQLYTLFR